MNTEGDDDTRTDVEILQEARDHLDAAMMTIGEVTGRIDERGEPDESLTDYDGRRLLGHLKDALGSLGAEIAELHTTSGVTAWDGKITGSDGKRYPPDRSSGVDVKQVAALRETGLSVRAIADKLGCSVGTAHGIVRKLGL